jgi:hypothetical protein
MGVNENNNQASTWWMKDGSFMRLKNFEMGYSFPKCRVFVRGTNLFTIAGFKLWDPELGCNGFAAYPISRVVSLGLDISFN